MESVVKQSNGPHPLLQLSGYLFHKIVVDQVDDVNGTQREVMFVTAHRDGKLLAFICGDHLPMRVHVRLTILTYPRTSSVYSFCSSPLSRPTLPD